MGLTVTTDDKGVMVFANEKEGQNGKFTLYSLGVSSKDKDKNWVSGYISCRFKRGVSVPNKAKIKINNAFYVVNKGGDKTYTSLMITDFEVLDSPNGQESTGDDWVNTDVPYSDDVPFE